MRYIRPVYGSDKKTIGVLAVLYDGTKISNTIKDVVVGKAGGIYMLDKGGTTIAHRNIKIVLSRDNDYEASKNNSILKSVGNFEHNAVNSSSSGTGTYIYEGIKKDASYAKVSFTGWTVIASAPTKEFMGSVKDLSNRLLILNIAIILIVLFIIFIAAHRISMPLQKTATALKNISLGDGDLTVTLPVKGNDEISDIADSFNLTIAKIAASIKSVEHNSDTMKLISENLSSNMTETASAINQISANIEGVKHQALTQDGSVTETAATVEEIIRTIKQLNASIETQATSVAQSSASIEEMVANIGSVTHTLKKSEDVIAKLSSATTYGKQTLS